MWKGEDQEYEGRVYLIQLAMNDVETLTRKFENDSFLQDFRLLTLSGFTDNNDVHWE
jgi:hypothetical protein